MMTEDDDELVDKLRDELFYAESRVRTLEFENAYMATEIERLRKLAIERPYTMIIAHDDGAVGRLARDRYKAIEAFDRLSDVLSQWECPREDRICLNCGKRAATGQPRNEPGPDCDGVACTFDMTYMELVAEVKRLRSDLYTINEIMKGQP